MALYQGANKIKDVYLGSTPIFKIYSGADFCGYFTLGSQNLVANSDLLIPKVSPNQNEPLGFTYRNTNDISLTNGIAKFTANAIYGRMVCYFDGNTGDKIYCFSKFKVDSKDVRLTIPTIVSSFHSGTNNFECVSLVYTIADKRELHISDSRSSGWAPIEVDYMGAINITDLVTRGILPSGLTDAEYKTILDNYFNS